MLTLEDKLQMVPSWFRLDCRDLTEMLLSREMFDVIFARNGNSMKFSAKYSQIYPFLYFWYV